MGRVEMLIKRHEGLRLKPYTDTVGKLTIGYGHNLSDLGLRPDEAEYLFVNDLDRATAELLQRLPWIAMLDEVRHAVLIDMSFNLGIGGLLGFKQTLASVQRGDYEAAAKGMMRSKWATQVGGRASRLAMMMRSGQWPGDIDLDSSPSQSS
jgi:lysozyme